MGFFRKMLQRLDAACALPQKGDVDFETLIAELGEGSYKWKSAEQRDAALRMLTSLREVARQSSEPGPSVRPGPRPRPELRARPRV